MTHPRTLIRRALNKQLNDYCPRWLEIHGSRRVPERKNSTRTLCFFIDKEVIKESSQTTSPVENSRYPTIHIEAITNHPDVDIDEDADSICEYIEKAMGSDETIGETCDTSHLIDTEITVDVGGERPVATIVMTYQAEYKTTYDTDDTIEDLETVGTVYNLESSQLEQDQASDVIQVRQ